MNKQAEEDTRTTCQQSWGGTRCPNLATGVIGFAMAPLETYLEYGYCEEHLAGAMARVWRVGQPPVMRVERVENAT